MLIKTRYFKDSVELSVKLGFDDDVVGFVDDYLIFFFVVVKGSIIIFYFLGQFFK